MSFLDVANIDENAEEMSSLTKHMSNGEKELKISVKEIRMNPNNFYAHIEADDENRLIEDLAQMILENGQDSNAVVYEDTSLNDGKKYTLIAGERRCKAIEYNFKNGGGDGMINVKVIKKPLNEDEELLRLVRNNSNRPKNKDIIRAEINAMDKVYISLEREGRKPDGLKRDWIGKQIGLKGRRVQEYLTGNEASNESNQEDEPEVIEEPNVKKDSLKDKLTEAEKEYLKMIVQNLTDSTGRKAKYNVTAKEIWISFSASDMDEIVDVLSDLGFDKVGNWKE